MEKNVEALKSVYVALGGELADVANMNLSCDVISAIAVQITENAPATTDTTNDDTDGE